MSRKVPDTDDNNLSQYSIPEGSNQRCDNSTRTPPEQSAPITLRDEETRLRGGGTQVMQRNSERFATRMRNDATMETQRRPEVPAFNNDLPPPDSDVVVISLGGILTAEDIYSLFGPNSTAALASPRNAPSRSRRRKRKASTRKRSLKKTRKTSASKQPSKSLRKGRSSKRKESKRSGKKRKLAPSAPRQRGSGARSQALNRVADCYHHPGSESIQLTRSSRGRRSLRARPEKRPPRRGRSDKSRKSEKSRKSGNSRKSDKSRSLEKRRKSRRKTRSQSGAVVKNSRKSKESNMRRPRRRDTKRKRSPRRSSKRSSSRKS